MEKTLAFDVMILRKDFVRYCNERLSEIGLSQSMLYFVLYVGKNPGTSPKHLAGGLQMDFGYVTRNLIQLEADGFLIQKVNPKDRRSHTLNLTEKGQQAFNLSHQLFDQWDRHALSVLTAEEKKQLKRLMEKLTAEEALKTNAHSRKKTSNPGRLIGSK